MKFIKVLGLCICDVFAYSHVTKIRGNAIITHWTFVISIMWREHLNACNANWQCNFKAEVNEDNAPGLKQSISLPASFLCLLATSVFALKFKIYHFLCMKKALSQCTACAVPEYRIPTTTVMGCDYNHCCSRMLWVRVAVKVYWCCV